MLDPFGRLSSQSRWVTILIVAAVAIAFALVLTRQGRPLKGPFPGGIGAYECAWHRHRAAEILRVWGPIRATVWWQLVLDFGFLVFYPAAIALACAMVAAVAPDTMSEVGRFLAWAVLLAGPLDAAENLALLWMLRHGASEAAAQVAGWCAAPKFALVFAGLGYFVLVGALVAVMGQRATP